MVALTAAVLSGCAADKVSGVRPAAASPAAAAAGAHACPFTVEAIDDKREAEDLGIMGRRRVGGENFASWFKSGVAAIPGHTAKPAPVKVHIEIVKAYIQGLDTLKSANLVVKMRMDDAKGTTQKTYRGVDSSMNWWNSESEMQAAFDAALADLQRQLASDLAASCSRAG